MLLIAGAGFEPTTLGYEGNFGVRFIARGAGYGLFITPDEAVMTHPVSGNEPLHMRLVGARRDVRLTGLDPLPGTTNYFVGNDPARWHRNVPSFARVRSEQVYPGIDLVYHGDQRRLEYDFVIAPHADPGRITLAFSGARRVSLDGDGNLVLSTAHGTLVQRKPLVYQEVGGERRLIDGRYTLRGKQARFRIGQLLPTSAPRTEQLET